MLDQLVESKSNAKENRTRGGYLLTTFFVVAGVLSGALVYSLFAKDLGIGQGEFELSKLIAPLSVAANAPEPVKSEPKAEQSKSAGNKTIVRQSNMLRIDESPAVPKDISVVPNSQKSRPYNRFLTRDGAVETGDANSFGSENGRNNNASNVGISNVQSTEIENNHKTIAPPAIKKPVVETPEKKKSAISGGVVNGKATSLPVPAYPAAAIAVRAEGSVSVEVTIDEAGQVISAKAVDGHPLLRSAAEKAARNAKFKPTLLSNSPVKVTGVIIYKFAPR